MQNGAPDLLINSAGVAHPGYFQELDLDIFHWMMDVNYFGTVNIIKAVIPDMISRGSGYIVNLRQRFFGRPACRNETPGNQSVNRFSPRY